MRVSHRITDLHKNIEILFQRLLPDGVLPGDTRNLFHRIEQFSIRGPAQIMNRNNVRMDKVGSDDSLGDEHRLIFIREVRLGLQSLDGQLAIQRELLSMINDAHTPCAEFAQDFILGCLFICKQCYLKPRSSGTIARQQIHLACHIASDLFPLNSKIPCAFPYRRSCDPSLWSPWVCGHRSTRICRTVLATDRRICVIRKHFPEHFGIRFSSSRDFSELLRRREYPVFATHHRDRCSPWMHSPMCSGCLF